MSEIPYAKWRRVGVKYVVVKKENQIKKIKQQGGVGASIYVAD